MPIAAVIVLIFLSLLLYFLALQTQTFPNMNFMMQIYFHCDAISSQLVCDDITSQPSYDDITILMLNFVMISSILHRIIRTSDQKMKPLLYYVILTLLSDYFYKLCRTSKKDLLFYAKLYFKQL